MIYHYRKRNKFNENLWLSFIFDNFRMPWCILLVFFFILCNADLFHSVCYHNASFHSKWKAHWIKLSCVVRIIFFQPPHFPLISLRKSGGDDSIWPIEMKQPYTLEKGIASCVDIFMFPQRPQSKLRKEFSFSVRFIENGAGRSRNQFHRIRIILPKEEKKKKK